MDENGFRGKRGVVLGKNMAAASAKIVEKMYDLERASELVKETGVRQI